jgi:predicted O-linked N-acetylglucosamine transferase (SPINDLY family)
LSQQAIAEQIRSDDIDILLDLNGHTRYSRPGVLAAKPAPIQVAFLGYPGTMGADFIDYIIADPVVLPMRQQPFFSEKIVHLPICYQPNDSRRPIAANAGRRADHGLPEAGFVFCSFNNSFKLSPDIFDVWMRLLDSVPGSVLWLLISHQANIDNLRHEAFRRGVAPGRLIFADRIDLPHHLARHRHADLFLDCWPCSAHTTASDALWAGLPILTLAGETFASRVAASLLTAVDLPELITTSPADYETMALQLARNPAILADLRRRLAGARATSPLFKGHVFARAIETAFEMMVRERL